jgi:hypothetical protein
VPGAGARDGLEVGQDPLDIDLCRQVAAGEVGLPVATEQERTLSPAIALARITGAAGRIGKTDLN